MKSVDVTQAGFHCVRNFFPRFEGKVAIFENAAFGRVGDLSNGVGYFAANVQQMINFVGKVLGLPLNGDNRLFYA